MSNISILTSTGKRIVIEPKLLSILRAVDPEATEGSFDRPSAYAMWEWAVPAGCVVVFAQPFFSAFMKKLGEAAGERALQAIKDQYLHVKAARERFYDRGHIEELQKREKDFSGDNDAWKEHIDDVGVKLLPLEFRVREMPWLTPLGTEVLVNYRFVFTPDLLPEDLIKAVFSLHKNEDQLLANLPNDYPHLIQEIQRRSLNVFPGTVEALFDQITQSWISFPSHRNRNRNNQ